MSNAVLVKVVTTDGCTKTLRVCGHTAHTTIIIISSSSSSSRSAISCLTWGIKQHSASRA